MTNLDPSDWVVINRIADEAISKILDFIEELGGNAAVVPTYYYFHHRLERERERRRLQRRVEELGIPGFINTLLDPRD